MNNKLKAVIFILLLFIPTYLAVAYYINAQSGAVDGSRGIEKMEISDPDGKSYLYTADKADGGAAEIEFLTSVNKNAKEQTDMPDALADAKIFRVVYTTFNRASTYEYYFTPNPDAAFFKDPEGKIFKINSQDASAFLCKDYAACMYNGSVHPVLKISGEEVLPQSLDWRYKLFNGAYRAMETETTDARKTYRMNARLAMSFNLEPDLIDISVYDGDELIYSDNYANLSRLSITEQKNLRFHIEAKWYEVDGKEGQGEAVYDFNARVNAPASFYLNVSTIQRGEFCVITVKDKPEDADVLFAAEPDINFTPTFVEDGDYYRALIPIACEQPAGNYTFTVSCDGVTQELLLGVTDKEFHEAPYSIDQSIINATRTEATLASFDELMKPVAQSLALGADHMFNGTFLEGPADTSLLITGFGRIRVINGGTKYQHQGVDYLVREGTDIQAVNDGVVIYVGATDLSGNIVVVEHGLGLKSWYCHLSETKVSKGDTVHKGDVIALSGDTGFCAQATAHIGLSVFEVPVCPYTLWEAEIPLNNP
ncbi:MAG: M23 family metallopeptidase [Clostridia bacterium]|nr:M23 family metallopeptidase [Clostridia bacterium]